MDIPRAPANRNRKRLIYGGIALLGLVAATLGLRSLKPAAPRVDRASVWIDSVQKGPLVIEVRGPGTLVPALAAAAAMGGVLWALRDASLAVLLPLGTALYAAILYAISPRSREVVTGIVR